jgi:hypothetical protein
MKADQLGDLLGQFHRWLVGRSPKWGDILVRLLIIGVLSQLAFLLFGLGLRFCVWVTFGH